MIADLCPQCGAVTKCLAGHSAHPLNWYCSNHACGWYANPALRHFDRVTVYYNHTYKLAFNVVTSEQYPESYLGNVTDEELVANCKIQ
jgi:hypothetical protein